jgi:phosphoribosylanthranilate isomerase
LKVRVVTVKICGLSDVASLDVALDAGADMVGFVFFEPSPRHIGLDQARALGERTAGRARKVALTVDADDAGLAALIEAAAPDIIQMHGHETPQRVAYVRARFGLPVMRAVGLATRGDLDQVAQFDSIADYLLFDARPPEHATRPGGNGDAFDWTLLRGLQARKPWLLAGGLRSDLLEYAMRATGATGFDVSSGVESAPGVKDHAAIARFVARARDAGERLGSVGTIG